MLVLHNRSFLPGSPQKRVMGWLGILLLFLITAAGALLYLIIYKSCPACDPGDIADAAWQRLREDMGMMFVLAATPLLMVSLFILAQGSRNRERLVLTETGMEYRSPLLGPLNVLQPDWSLQWLEVRRAWIGPMFRFASGQFTCLFLDAGGNKRRVLLYPWVDPRDYHPRSLRAEKAYIEALQKQQGPEYQALTTDSPVVRFISEHVRGVEIEPASPRSSAFALEKHPWTLAMVVLFFLLVAYTVVDGFMVIGETYVSRPAYELFAVGGLAAAILATRLLRAKAVPPRESALLGALLGAAIGCALYPGALRLNQWTDSAGLQVHTYRSQGEGRFTPPDESLPELRFEDHSEYWRQIGAGESREFELRRGGLGFYQLNMRPIHKAVVAFYRNKERAGREATTARPG